MRKPLIAGNWKCNMRLDTAFELAHGIYQRLNEVDGVDIVLCPPFIYLASVESVLTMSNIGLGAQDVHWQDDIAATGEIGPQQLEELCDYAIIGHSERRASFCETDDVVNRKVKAALATGLKPIMCVGETLEEREAGEMEAVLVRQTRGGLDGVDVSDTFVIAYEPVWAIGTGRAATADDAEQAIDLIRREVASISGAKIADSVRILYGGSVTADNIAGFLERETIDGGLVGGASLKVDAFCGIVEEALRVRA
jgi:triosephosphate isomerase (TIM)